MGEPILVIGATGNVGQVVAERLMEKGLQVRAAVRDVSRARAQLGDGLTYVRFDLLDPSTFAAAFEGVKRMFLVRPPALADVQRELVPAMRYAAENGVEQVVFLSLLGVERNRFVPHAAIESYLEGSGMAYTFLRAGFFMQNLNTMHRAHIRDHDELFIPAGRGRTAFVDVRDIGAVGALSLSEPGHERRAYRLTGSEVLNYEEVAELMSATLGRTIRYTNPTPWAYGRRLRREGTPPAFVRVMNMLYLTVRFGMASERTEEVARLLGRPPITLRQYIRDYAAQWEPVAGG